MLQRVTKLQQSPPSRYGSAEHCVTTFRAVHQVDTTRRTETFGFLSDSATEWHAKSHPRNSFWLDLIRNPAGHCRTHDFLWWQYLNSTEWGQVVVLDVRHFYPARLEERNHQGFWIRLRIAILERSTCLLIAGVPSNGTTRLTL